MSALPMPFYTPQQYIELEETAEGKSEYVGARFSRWRVAARSTAPSEPMSPVVSARGCGAGRAKSSTATCASPSCKPG